MDRIDAKEGSVPKWGRVQQWKIVTNFMHCLKVVAHKILMCDVSKNPIGLCFPLSGGHFKAQFIRLNLTVDMKITSTIREI